jgi:hypothetical protein
MAIASAVEIGSSVYIYDENGRKICSLSGGGSAPDDGLKGHTGSSVRIRRGSSIYIYDAKGRQISSIPVR